MFYLISELLDLPSWMIVLVGIGVVVVLLCLSLIIYKLIKIGKRRALARQRTKKLEKYGGMGVELDWDAEGNENEFNDNDAEWEPFKKRPVSIGEPSPVDSPNAHSHVMEDNDIISYKGFESANSYNYNENFNDLYDSQQSEDNRQSLKYIKDSSKKLKKYNARTGNSGQKRNNTAMNGKNLNVVRDEDNKLRIVVSSLDNFNINNYDTDTNTTTNTNINTNTSTNTNNNNIPTMYDDENENSNFKFTKNYDDANDSGNDIDNKDGSDSGEEPPPFESKLTIVVHDENDQSSEDVSDTSPEVEVTEAAIVEALQNAKHRNSGTTNIKDVLNTEAIVVGTDISEKEQNSDSDNSSNSDNSDRNSSSSSDDESSTTIVNIFSKRGSFVSNVKKRLSSTQMAFGAFLDELRNTKNPWNSDGGTDTGVSSDDNSNNTTPSPSPGDQKKQKNNKNNNSNNRTKNTRNNRNYMNNKRKNNNNNENGRDNYNRNKLEKIDENSKLRHNRNKKDLNKNIDKDGYEGDDSPDREKHESKYEKIRPQLTHHHVHSYVYVRRVKTPKGEDNVSSPRERMTSPRRHNSPVSSPKRNKNIKFTSKDKDTNKNANKNSKKSSKNRNKNNNKNKSKNKSTAKSSRNVTENGKKTERKMKDKTNKTNKSANNISHLSIPQYID